MIKKIGQPSSPSFPPVVETDSQTTVAKKADQQNIQPQLEKAAVDSKKGLITLEGQIRQSQLETALLKAAKKDSHEEANAIAKARLEEGSLNYNTGEPVTSGDPQLKPGVYVKIKPEDDRIS